VITVCGVLNTINPVSGLSFHEAPVLVSRGGLGFGTTALKRNFFDDSCVDSVLPSPSFVSRDYHAPPSQGAFVYERKKISHFFTGVMRLEVLSSRGRTPRWSRTQFLRRPCVDSVLSSAIPAVCTHYGPDWPERQARIFCSSVFPSLRWLLRVNLFRFLEEVVAAVAVAVAAAWVLPRLFLLDSPENKQSVSTWS
jgi:hypothetical protein